MSNENKSVASALASLLEARSNCLAHGNTEWKLKHEDKINEIVRNNLPSGSGVDSGTSLDYDKSTADRIVLGCGFHHMDESGFYDGWTQHEVIVTPTFGGVHVRITGVNRNEIKDYLGELYHSVLTELYILR